LFSKEVCFIGPNFAGLILTGCEIRRQPLSGPTSPFAKIAKKYQILIVNINKSGDAIFGKNSRMFPKGMPEG